jgi:hypothetical protein
MHIHAHTWSLLKQEGSVNRILELFLATRPFTVLTMCRQQRKIASNSSFSCKFPDHEEWDDTHLMLLKTWDALRLWRGHGLNNLPSTLPVLRFHETLPVSLNIWHPDLQNHQEERKSLGVMEKWSQGKLKAATKKGWLIWPDGLFHSEVQHVWELIHLQRCCSLNVSLKVHVLEP